MGEYPRNLAELEARFGSEDACREYLTALRWPEGFRCPRCGAEKAWPVGGLHRCSVCRCAVSVTAGRIFEGTRKPLAVWFRAIWWVVSQKNGASAKGIQPILELGSYQTAWAWLHKLRRADHRGLLFYRLLQNAVQTEATTYRHMVKNVRGRKPSNHNM